MAKSDTIAQLIPTVPPGAVGAPMPDACADVKPALNKHVVATPDRAGSIVYLTNDGNIAISDAAGTTQTALTDDAAMDKAKQRARVYQYPTFSADAAAVGFVRIEVSAVGFTQTLGVADAAGVSAPRDLFATSEFNIPYLDWSPDGRTLAFLTIGQGQGAINIVSPEGGEPAVAIERGQPTYWHWRHDSRAMVTHLGGSAPRSYISLVDMPASGAPTQDVLSAAPGNFQSPQLAPDGAHMLFVVGASDGDTLVLADGAGDLICTLAKIAQGAFFAWSPDGVHLALLDSPAPLSEPAAIEIYDARDGSHHQAHEQASAFFWSPDGQSLVVYSLRSGVAATVLDAAPPAIVVDTAQVDPVLRIEAVDAASGRAVFVADTLPTRSFAQYLPFFDQYSRAVTPWSPDGRRLVFATRDTADHSSIAQATFPAGPLGAPSLSMVAPGGLAFYSPK